MAGMRGVVRKILFPAGKGGKWMEKDITTKNLLENNDVFADIANVNLFGGDLLIKQEDLEEMPADASYKDLEGRRHKLSRDILKKVNRLGGCIAFIGYENQTGINNVMPIRNMGYNYTVYAKQIQHLVAENRKNKKSAYAKVLHDHQKLMPVATFVLYYGKKRWRKPLTLMDVLDIPEEDRGIWEKLLSDYRIKVIHMADQPEEVRKMYRSDYRVIADYLAYRKNKKKLYVCLREDRREIIHVEQLLDMLGALSGDGRFVEIRESYVNSENKEEGMNMCTLLDMCEKEGMKKGVEEGMKKGVKKGVKKGMKRGVKKGITLTKKVLQMDAQGRSMEEIAGELNVKGTVVKRILS